MKINNETLIFSSLDEFEAWKVGEEEKSTAHYVQQSAVKMISDGSVTHLVCNRSGNPRPSRSTGKRQQKSQGSCKSGEFCLSHMKVMVNASSGQVTVEYCSSHTGHSSQIAHIPIPNQIKLEISSKLHAGVTVERIIDDIRNDVDGGLKRKHLATKLDINNIKRKINLENVEKDKNDSVSVRAWVKQLEKKEYNPILLFKCQGDEHAGSQHG